MRSVNKAGTKELVSAMKEPELIYAYQSHVALLSRSAGIRRMPHTEKISGPFCTLFGLETKFKGISIGKYTILLLYQ